MRTTVTVKQLIANTELTGECWVWRRAKSDRGYGTLQVRGKSNYVHRLMFGAVYGDIPRGLMVCHSCDNPACINPEHLFLGDQFDNMRDAAWKHRLRLGEKHPQARLTAQAAREIKRDHGNTSLRLMALKYGVTRGAIVSVKKGRTWIDA